MDTPAHTCVQELTVTDPLTARLAVRFGRDGLQDVLDVWPCLLVASWHNGWAVAGALLSSGDTTANESDALLSQISASSVGVWEMRVATVDDDIALLKTPLSEKSLNELVDSCSGLDEEHHTSGLLELGGEFLDAVGADNGLALGLVLQEAVDLGDSSVESHDSEAVVSHVEDQVLTHDGQANEAEISAVDELAIWKAYFGDTGGMMLEISSWEQPAETCGKATALGSLRRAVSHD